MGIRVRNKMHIVFIPYGKRSEVELLLSDMSAQKHELEMRKDSKIKKIWIQGQVRVLPFGVYEYVCPKEDAETVLNTLNFYEPVRYDVGYLKLAFMRKALKLKTPKPKINNKIYLWVKQNVNIIPLGIKEDLEFTDKDGENVGWTHEAI